MRQFLLLFVCAMLAGAPLSAADIAPRSGWVVLQTQKSHADLLDDLKASVKRHKMGIVTQAGPTATARKRGIDIPENRVVGVFNNDYAVKILALSTAAMIEAPVRFYVTENTDGTATLSYKTPTSVFAPYQDEGGAALKDLAGELDGLFEDIAQDAAR